MNQPQPTKTVWIYDAGNGKTIEFETADEARAWFEINDPEGVAFEHPAPDPDPKEAYEIVPMKPEPHGPPGAAAKRAADHVSRAPYLTTNHQSANPMVVVTRDIPNAVAISFANSQ